MLTPGEKTELEKSDYDALKLYNLTLQGGWNGATGAAFALNGQTDFGSNRVRIGEIANPWVGNITINNISISGVTGGTNTINNTGLVVYTAGTVNINSVISQNNAANGAILGDPTSPDGSVTVQNSSFNNNTRSGLRVFSDGVITLNNVIAQHNGKLGAEVEAEAAEIICSQFSGNDTYGLDGTLATLLTLDDVVFGGNGSGDYLGSPFVTRGGCSSDEGGEEGGEESSSSDPAEIIPLTGLTLHIVSVTGGENVDLDCDAFSGTKLVLPNVDSVTLPCPIRDEGLLVAQAQDALPGQLDAEFSSLSGVNTGVVRDGQAVSTVEPSRVVEFVIPDGQNAENLVILHWDGSEWIELSGSVTADGHFAAATNFTGIFVLVTK